MDFIDFWHQRDLLFASSSAVSIVILGLMLFMAYRLIVLGRRKAYRNMLLSLGVISIYHLFQFTVALKIIQPEPLIRFGGSTLHVIAFVMLNFAVFELYYKPRPRTRAWFYGLLAIGLTIAACNLFAGYGGKTASLIEANTMSPVLDGFMLLLAPLFGLMFAPHIRQSRRYVFSLIFAFGGELGAMILTYGHVDSTYYAAAATVLPVGYYILLFMILFERVAELLQSTYRSSITDGLTNMYNRRFFMGQLDHALRGGRPLGAIFCDIDNFKKLNDTQGHQQADIVLKQVAAILMEETEGIGMAGRYGGEELVAFVSNPGTSSSEVAERVRARVAKETIVTVSVGHCMATPGIASDHLMKHADEAMYHAKHSGKNRMVDFATLTGASDDAVLGASVGSAPKATRRRGS